MFRSLLRLFRVLRPGSLVPFLSARYTLCNQEHCDVFMLSSFARFGFQ